MIIRVIRDKSLEALNLWESASKKGLEDSRNLISINDFAKTTYGTLGLGQKKHIKN